MNRGVLGFPRKYSDPTTRFRRAPKLFRPSDYGTCVQWVRASDCVESFADQRNTQLLATWSDLSGNSNNFASIAAGAQFTGSPLWYPRAWRGFPGVRFMANGMSSSAVPATGANARTVAYVLGQVTQQTGRGILSVYGTNASLQTYGLSINASSLTLQVYYNGTITTTTGNLSSIGVPDVIVHVFDGTNDKVYLNGSQVHTGTPVLNTGSTNGINLGKATAATELGFFTLYEFAAWSTNLAVGDITAITSILQGQYECG